MHRVILIQMVHIIMTPDTILDQHFTIHVIPEAAIGGDTAGTIDHTDTAILDIVIREEDLDEFAQADLADLQDLYAQADHAEVVVEAEVEEAAEDNLLTQNSAISAHEKRRTFFISNDLVILKRLKFAD